MAMEQPGMTRLPYVWKPSNTAEAWSLKRSLSPNAEYVAGGTLLRTWWEGGAAEQPAQLIDIRPIPGLSGIQYTEGGDTVIGACTSLSEVRRNAELAARYPALTEAVRRIGAPSVRNVGTLGGNAASGTGDALPALMVYEAELLWYDGQEELKPVEQWLELPAAYRQNREKLLIHLRLPFRPAETDTHINSENTLISAYHKVGRREAFTPSDVTIALSAAVSADGRLTRVRAAAGGGATVPHRLYVVESLLEGKPCEPDSLPKVHEAVEDTFRPKGDVFAGEAYRKRTAANLFAAELWKLAAGWPEKE